MSRRRREVRGRMLPQRFHLRRQGQVLPELSGGMDQVSLSQRAAVRVRVLHAGGAVVLSGDAAGVTAVLQREVLQGRMRLEARTTA
jgi:hypothetical protein